jgi:hypothetical protein
MPQPFPKATGANLRGTLGYKPGLRLGKGRIGLAPMGAKGVVVCGEFLFYCDHLARAPSKRICPEMALNVNAGTTRFLQAIGGIPESI